MVTHDGIFVRLSNACPVAEMTIVADLIIIIHFTALVHIVMHACSNLWNLLIIHFLYTVCRFSHDWERLIILKRAHDILFIEVPIWLSNFILRFQNVSVAPSVAQREVGEIACFHSHIKTRHTMIALVIQWTGDHSTQKY